MHGRASAPAAATVVNALATGTGCAVAVDRRVTVAVDLDRSGTIEARTTAPNAAPDEVNAGLLARCVERAVDRFGDPDDRPDDVGGTVETDSEIPVAVGLGSSSAVANATVAATCAALDADPDPLAVCRTGVAAAREAGVTATGAFDDAAASALGGLALTDNDSGDLLATDAPDWTARAWIPPRRAYAADADVERCRRVAPLASLAVELVDEGRYARAMTVNGFAYAPALGLDPEPLVEALAVARGVSHTGTGPAVVAVGEREPLADLFDHREGTAWPTTTTTTGVTVE